MKMENLAAIMAAAFGAYIIYNHTNKAAEAKKRADEIDALPMPKDVQATITTATAAAIAERQYKAMASIGTDEDALFRSLVGLNGADLRLVYRAFGMRRYSWTIGDRDLFGWYANELNNSELQRMKILWWKAGIGF